ncbi:MAG TPA: TonB-dependent receptor [Gemmatimonadaceae bacterium]|nr:TonB-dependent receptor [Gemmatimonadaceae bacterium]
MSGILSRVRALATLLALFAVASPLLAQPAQPTIRGTVVADLGGEPVASANVVVRGTTIGTVTNERGEFTLRVRSLNDTLQITRIGFAAQTIPLAGRERVDVRMRAAAALLSEIVVVGYGTQKRSDITGAVASVSKERLEGRPNTSPVQAIAGAIPGVSVTTTGAGAEQAFDVLVRGRNSISARTTPLYVIDGIPYDGTLSEINPNDIESIEVLKDASSVAIYGARGSNGVILITTKKGTGRPRVNYRAYYGVQELADKPRVMTGEEFAAFKCQRINGGTNCESALTATELANFEAGKFVDWFDLALRQGNQQQHDLSFSGGTDDTKYHISGGLLRVNGIALNDEFERASVRLNVEQKIRSWLSIGTSTQLSQTDRGGMPASFEDAFWSNPLANVYDANGNLTISPWPEDLQIANPLQGLRVIDDDVSRRVFSSNYVNVTVPKLPGLSYRFNGGIDMASREQGTYYGRDTRVGAEVQGRATIENADRLDWTAENILRYTKTFAGKHTVDLTTLYSAQHRNLDTRTLRAEGFPNDVMTYHQANVAALNVPGYQVIESNLISQMGRLNYNYADRYLLTTTIRRDGSSVFGANHKYGVFPSVAVAWNVSNEPFWNVRSINVLKTRLSYGSTGNQAINPYQTLAGLDDYSYVDANGQTAPGYRPTSLGNPDLRWETTNAVNLGLDFGLFDDRISGSLELYRSNTHDLLLRRTISPTHGITGITQNIGKTANKGIEFSVSTLNVDLAGFNWRTDFNVSANRNEIVDLYGDGKDDVASGWFIGHPIDVNYGYKFDGIWQVGDDIAGSAQKTAKPGDVKVLDRNGDGQITPDDRMIQGSLQPSYIAGMTNSVRWRGWDASAFLQTVQGITQSNSLLGVNLAQTGVRRNILLREYWTPENPINTYPANREGTNPFNAMFLQDRSFVRLKDVSLGYTVPTRVANRFGFQNLKVYANGRNLWTSTDWTGLDPEINVQRSAPLEKTYMLGLDVRF